MTAVVTWPPLIEGLLESVLIVDGLDLRIRLVNSAATRLLGMSRDSLIGRPVIDLAASPEDQFFWEDVAAGLASDIFSETTLCRADGSIVKVDRRVSRVLLEHNTSFYLLFYQ